MKTIYKNSVLALMFALLFLISGGSILTHIGCSHCATRMELASNPHEAGCCGKHQTDHKETDDCVCNVVQYAFESERNHLLHADVLSLLQPFLHAVYTLLPAGLLSGFDSDTTLAFKAPPLDVSAYGRTLLCLIATFRI